MNNPFDRTNLGLRERPVSSDFNRNVSQSDRSLRDTLRYMLSARPLASAAGVPYTGFIGDGFRVVPASPIGMTVQLTAGLGFFYDPISVPIDLGLPDLEGVDDRSDYKPMAITVPTSLPVPAAPGTGNSRIDIIEARYDRRLEDPQTRRQLDVSSKSFLDHVFSKTLSFVLDGQTGTVSNPAASTAAISYKVGTVAATGSQVEPSVTSGYVKIARINVGPNVTTIDKDVLVDRRPMLYPGGLIPFSGTWRVQWNSGSPTATAYSIQAPPGVTLTLLPALDAVHPATNRGIAQLYALGGQILGGSITITGQPNMNQATIGTYSFSFQTLQAAGDAVNAPHSRVVDSTFQTQLLASVPSVSVGIGTTMLVGKVISRFVDAAGVSDATDASLEDMLVQVSGALRYS